MNFYAAQDQARKQSFWLVFLFSIAVLILVLLTNICVAFFVLYSNPEHALNGADAIADAHGNVLLWLDNLVNALGWQKFLWVTVLVIGGIAMAVFFKWLEVKDGGRVVAESLGGRQVLTNTRDSKEKMLLNVVEEIAIASGIPVPQVFLLGQEVGINAFAAGLSTEDAVIGVTQGSLEAFDRDQLQGVVAHEFSHILNGDMRLNMKLLVVLHGILLIAESGRLFMRMASHGGRYRHRNRNGGVVAGLFAFGLCLWVLGSIGQLFASIIKSAVSRQREYLADASAVQFTRNPEGIGQALAIIGGASCHSALQHQNANELSHLFFSSSSRFNRLTGRFFATHPPLEDRIKRVWPAWKGRFIKPANNSSAHDPSLVGEGEAASTVVNFTPLAQSTSQSNESFVSAATSLKEELEPIEYDQSLAQEFLTQTALEKLQQLAHEPADSSNLLYALLCDDNEAIRTKQMTMVRETSESAFHSLVSIYKLVQTLPLEDKLRLVELTIPSLKSISKHQYIAFRKLAAKLIQADGKVDLSEWLFFQILRQHGDRHFGLSKIKKPKFKHIQELAEDYQVVLSRLVHAGEHDVNGNAEGLSEKAFHRACNTTGLYNLNLLPVDKCKGEQFSKAIERLTLSYPLLKPRIIKGFVAAAKHNDVINHKEYCLVKGIAATLDCPLVGFEIQS